MSTIQVHLPDSLQQQLHALAARDGISIDQFIATAVAEKMAALLTEAYLEERAKMGFHRTRLLGLHGCTGLEIILAH
jgi:hypothetical protein